MKAPGYAGVYQREHNQRTQGGSQQLIYHLVNGSQPNKITIMVNST